MLGTLLIGLREGLEAALVVGILLTYASRIGRPDVARRIWIGVGIAVAASLTLGAVLTFGAYGLSFEAQELLGGTLSIIAVGMVTWMVFWMLKVSRHLRSDLESSIDRRLGGSGWGLTAVAVAAVGREGIETALFVWSTTRADDSGLLGFATAIGGILIACGAAWLITRGLVRLDLGAFFRWTGLALLVVAAGVLAYAVHDLQEARFLPGPFEAAPAMASSFVQSWYGEAAWAFRIPEIIPPDSLAAVLLKGTIGFSPEMTRLEVIAWAVYLVTTVTIYLRIVLRGRAPKPATAETRTAGPADIPAEPEPRAATKLPSTRTPVATR